MEGTRLDKWLWAARFFKSRALATRACELGRIHLNSQPAKPAREVKPGDNLRVVNDSGEFIIEVLQISEARGPAAVAATLYSESDDSRVARHRAADERRAAGFIPAPASRPSKRDRRLIHRFRGEG